MRDSMTMTMTATTDEWMQFYQQPLMDDHHALPPNREGFSDATVMTTSPTPILSPTNSYTTSCGQLTPKGNVSKPIRRRSRASKRTPTTLLNANTTNFRALVQQFTGCPSTAMSTLATHKGPITLNFQQGSGHKNTHHNTSKIMFPFTSKSYNNQAHHVPIAAPVPWKNQQHQEQVHHHQPQQSGYSFDYVKSNGLVPTTGNSMRPSSGMDVSDDGLLLDNDFSLHDLTVNAFPNDTF
ncbi:hypothetical protein RJT34_14787 [Clitoria ternatea]|uniref:VQ domain-containing protein n=1 Tax=Clitoria ternatea TaxID=43366 RepID=A0AAN9JQZ6_CLITE